ncbi:MAG: glycosyltransferase [Cyclobacteriaceae bacterium]|nr:glycosyltransferase [Cyclobacteriaceae bacterium]
MKKVRKIALMAVGDSAWQGGIQYVTNILHAINTISDQNEFEIHLFKRQHQHFQNLENFTKISLTIHSLEKVLPAFTLPNRIYWFLQRKLFGRINPQSENYFLSQGFDFIYPATLSSCGKQLNSGSWIADFQYYNYPEGHNRETTIAAERVIGLIAKETDKVILSSKYCEKQGFELFPVIKGKSHVMPFTVYINRAHLNDENLQEVRDTYGLGGQYIMVSNLFGATKNHKTLFEALGILRKKGIVIICVCTGNLVNHTQMEFTNEILQIITRTGIRSQLFLLGLIPREHQVALYRMAMLLVQPSMHEGWSTCVEEAKALGKALVLSDIDVHKEQDPNNPYFFQTMNAEDLAVVLQRAYEKNVDRQFPELEIEQNALRQYESNVRAFGENFMSIANYSA